MKTKWKLASVNHSALWSVFRYNNDADSRSIELIFRFMDQVDDDTGVSVTDGVLALLNGENPVAAKETGKAYHPTTVDEMRDHYDRQCLEIQDLRDKCSALDKFATSAHRQLQEQDERLRNQAETIQKYQTDPEEEEGRDRLIGAQGAVIHGLRETNSELRAELDKKNKDIAALGRLVDEMRKR